MAQKIIDMRSRPAFLHDFYGKTPGTPSFEVVKWLNGRVGSKDKEHFTRSSNADEFVKEIKGSGITAAVVVGRDTPGIKHTNDEIKSMTDPFKELIGIGSVDPYAMGIRAAVNEVERAVGKLKLKGINVEPAFGSPPVAADDRQFYPVYDACDKLGVPVTIMSGPTAANHDLVHPSAVANIARAFPTLTIVCYHGFYPYVNEILGVALRYENVHIVPDMYIFGPGGGLYVEAANGTMGEQILFGSSYPFRPMGQSIEDYGKLGFSSNAIDKVMYKNAKRVLKVSV